MNVTPSHVDLTDPLDCGNYGTETVQVDPNHPEQMYTLFFCQGIWKSTDYGQTWNGPINTGVNGDKATSCAGGITIPPNDGSDQLTIYEACIRGDGVGFSRSTNGGVDWTQYDVNVPGGTNQFYPPVVDPYDAKHILISGHGFSEIAESTDGGETWTGASLDPGMAAGATGGINFINTGDPATTRKTWLWLAQGTGGVVGTWRTANGGTNWTHVAPNEHPGGISQIYQPDAKGVVYMGGEYGGSSIFRSADYGETWTPLADPNLIERVVFGTPKQIYVMMGNEIGGTGTDPAFQAAPQPGMSGWTMPAVPPTMTQGPLQAVVTSDGKNSIVLLASWTSGLWRYVEP